MTRNLSLFDDMVLDAPSTQGIKYAGSKLKLLPHILELVKQTDAKTVLDGFSGSTRVSQSLAKMGYRVVSNDVAVWSEVFATCFLLNRRPKEDYAKLISHLNAQEPKEIDRLALSPIENAVALTSLILALDRVDSTLGHFVSYLKDWSPRSYNELHLEVPKLIANTMDHEVYRKDIFDLADVDVDLAYLDPPYGSNNEKMPPSRVRYASYYHLWTTICLNDKPELFGKAMRSKDTSDTVATSVFEEFRRNSTTGRFFAVEAIEKLIRCIRALDRFVLQFRRSGNGK